MVLLESVDSTAVERQHEVSHGRDSKDQCHSGLFFLHLKKAFKCAVSWLSRACYMLSDGRWQIKAVAIDGLVRD